MRAVRVAQSSFHLLSEVVEIEHELLARFVEVRFDPCEGSSSEIGGHEGDFGGVGRE